MSPAAQLGDIDLWEHPMEEKKDQGWWRLTQCLTWPDTPHRPHICGFPDCVWVSHTSMPLHVLCPLPGIISSTSKATCFFLTVPKSHLSQKLCYLPLPMISP